VTSLNRAISFIQVDIVAMAISEDLELNVARLLDILFDNDVLIIEALASFTLRSI